MKSIEIKTTQNVVLQYELANFRERAVAFFIDLLCLGVGLSTLSGFLYPAFGDSETGAAIVAFILSCVFIFYSLAWEVWNNGQSIGKMAMKIRVIKTAGGHATFSDYAARWVFRMIDIYFSFGGIASILIISSSKAQRIGDIVANTAVVKVNSTVTLKLNDLLAIKTQQSYQPQFVQARQLVEEDVLLIKSALDRHRKYHNAAHEEVLAIAAKRVKELLGLDAPGMDNRKFLQTVLNDYVVLTR
jgi:uncharacterized RDD family membrane protein YckC